MVPVKSNWRFCIPFVVVATHLSSLVEGYRSQPFGSHRFVVGPLKVDVRGRGVFSVVVHLDESTLEGIIELNRADPFLLAEETDSLIRNVCYEVDCVDCDVVLDHRVAPVEEKEGL